MAVEVCGHGAFQRDHAGNDRAVASQVQVDVLARLQVSGTFGPDRNGSSFQGVSCAPKAQRDRRNIRKLKAPVGAGDARGTAVLEQRFPFAWSANFLEKDGRALHGFASVAELTADGREGP